MYPLQILFLGWCCGAEDSVTPSHICGLDGATMQNYTHEAPSKLCCLDGVGLPKCMQLHQKFVAWMVSKCKNACKLGGARITTHSRLHSSLVELDVQHDGAGHQKYIFNPFYAQTSTECDWSWPLARPLVALLCEAEGDSCHECREISE